MSPSAYLDLDCVSFLGTDGHVAECLSRLCVVFRYRWSCRRVLVQTLCRFTVQMVMSPSACLDLDCVSFLGTDGHVAECLSILCVVSRYRWSCHRVLVQTVSFLGTDGHVAESLSRSRLCVVSRYRSSCRRVLCLDCVSFLGTDCHVAECLSILCVVSRFRWSCRQELV